MVDTAPQSTPTIDDMLNAVEWADDRSSLGDHHKACLRAAAKVLMDVRDGKLVPAPGPAHDVEEFYRD